MTTVTSNRILIGEKVYIYPRGNRKIYCADYSQNNSHCRKSLHTRDLSIARKRAAQLDASLDNANFLAPISTRKFISVAIEEYLTEPRKPKTQTKYRYELQWFKDFLANVNVNHLHQITPPIFNRYRQARGQGKSQKTLYTAETVIRQWLGWCVKCDYLAKSPCRATRIKKPMPVKQFTPDRTQVQSIIDSATGERKIQYAIGAYTGLRAGEIQMLRPCNIDIAAGWIHIRPDGTWTPKNSLARKVPMHSKLKVLLENESRRSGPYFFCSSPSQKYPNGDHCINIKHMSDDLQSLARRLGIQTGRKNKGMVFHSLRHFFETQTVNSKIPQFVVDAWMGHSSQNVIGKLYYELKDDESQRFMNEVEF